MNTNKSTGQLAGAPYVYLTFEGLRESRTIADKHTRIRIALPLSAVARLRELLVHPADQDATHIVI